MKVLKLLAEPSAAGYSLEFLRGFKSQPGSEKYPRDTIGIIDRNMPYSTYSSGMKASSSRMLRHSLTAAELQTCRAREI
jgi:hypothetical protein